LAPVKDSGLSFVAPVRTRLVEFQRQSVRIAEEDKAPPRVFVDADIFDRHAMTQQSLTPDIHIVDGEGEMTQSASLGIRRPRRRVGKREQFHLSTVGQTQVQLPGIARRAVVLGQYGHTQHLGVEAARAGIVGTDDGGVVQMLEHDPGPARPLP
jgi:hypothetical protein